MRAAATEGRRWFAGLGTLLLAACADGDGSRPADAGQNTESAPPASSPATPVAGNLADCAWLLRSDPVLVNFLYPDQDAVYYISVVPAVPGLELRIRGEFPHSRYMSFVSYDGLPVDAVLDRELPPEAGSQNPYRVGADRSAAARAYQLELRAEPPPTDPSQRVPGVLYTGAGQGGVGSPVAYLFYRLYVPDQGSGATGGVPLPQIELAGQPLPEAFQPLSCERLRQLLPSLAGVPEAYAQLDSPALPLSLLRAEPEPVWTVESGLTAGALGGTPLAGEVSGGPGSNPHNKYIAAPVSRAYGDLLLLRARAPSAPRTREGQALMTDGELRYWSICMNSRSTRYISCRSDSDIVVDPDGQFTLVISTPDARPASARNWLPFGPEPEGQLLYRHMLPSPQFYPYSAQGGEHSGQPLAATMGAYYPRARYCSREEFEVNRCGL